MFDRVEWSLVQVLIVTGPPNLRAIMRNHCKNLGVIDIDEAKTAKDALEMMSRKHFSVILVHSEVEPSGVKLIEFKEKKGNTTPTVLINDGGITPETIFEAADAGAEYILQLPIRAQVLMKAMHIAITDPTAFRDRAQKLKAGMIS
jgi:DNA-binding NtrC family response regulator